MSAGSSGHVYPVGAFVEEVGRWAVTLELNREPSRIGFLLSHQVRGMATELVGEAELLAKARKNVQLFLRPSSVTRNAGMPVV